MEDIIINELKEVISFSGLLGGDMGMMGNHGKKNHNQESHRAELGGSRGAQNIPCVASGKDLYLFCVIYPLDLSSYALPQLLYSG